MKRVDKIVVESQVRDIRALIDKHQDLHVAMEKAGILRQFKKLNEAISGEDWGRIGVLAGLLWYKLDTLIKYVSDTASTLKSIERNTSRGK
jgi:hypothetical protein